MIPRLRLLAAVLVLAGIGLSVPPRAWAAPHGLLGRASMMATSGQVTSSNNTYDIEASNYYCSQTPAQNCFARFNSATGQYSFSPDVTFASVQVHGMPGQAAGRPANLYVTCQTRFTPAGPGTYTYQYEYAYVAGSTSAAAGSFDTGTIASGSSATLGPHFVTEVPGQAHNAPNAFGQINISAYDAVSKTQVTATGISYANDYQLTANGPHVDVISQTAPNPGFTIHLTGTLYQFNPTGTDFVVGQNVPLSCTAGGHVGSVSYVWGRDANGFPLNQYAENEFEPIDAAG